MSRASAPGGRSRPRGDRSPRLVSPIQREMSTSMNAEPSWSIEMLVLNEALARSRMQQAEPRRTQRGARRPARVVAAAAARLRDRL
jgi:hypothetical protein